MNPSSRWMIDVLNDMAEFSRVNGLPSVNHVIQDTIISLESLTEEENFALRDNEEAAKEKKINVKTLAKSNIIYLLDLGN